MTNEDVKQVFGAAAAFVDPGHHTSVIVPAFHAAQPTTVTNFLKGAVNEVIR